MYGLVNQAVEEMIQAQYGSDAWHEVKRKAETDVDIFVRMESYPDDITYRIVGAACEYCEVSPEQLLEDIGIYWVKFTGASGYGEFLETAGSTLFEVLANLDDMHSRIALIYPKLQPPSFQCDVVSADEVVLHYRSHREGLAHMVIGLIKGLGQHLDTEVSVTRLQKREEGADHDSFAIKQSTGQ